MLTRKDFELIADKLRGVRPIATHEDLDANQWAKDVVAVGEALALINPRFDLVLFAKTCGRAE